MIKYLRMYLIIIQQHFGDFGLLYHSVPIRTSENDHFEL